MLNFIFIFILLSCCLLFKKPSKVTTYGYGFLEDIPAAYVLKYIGLGNWRMVIRNCISDFLGKWGTNSLRWALGDDHWFFGEDTTWPRRIDTGYQSLVTVRACRVVSCVRCGKQVAKLWWG